MGAVFNKNVPRRADLKKNDINTCAQFGDDAKRVHNASCIHSALFASGGAHFGFFSDQREQDEMNAVRVRGLFCVITELRTVVYVIFTQNGPPRAPEAAHGTHRCAELQMQKVTSGNFASF